MDEPTKADKFLGCQHTITEMMVQDGSSPYKAGGNSQRADSFNKKVRVMTYDMSDFLSSCVDRYCELAKTTRDKLKKVATPFLDESRTRRESDSNDLVWPLSLGKRDNTDDTDELREDATATGKGKLADIA